MTSQVNSDPSRVLVVSSTFPSRIQPIHGVFVKERLRRVQELPAYDLSVVAPTPYFPPLKRFKRWYTFSQLPKDEAVDNLDVHRPRYFLPPKIGGYMHPRLMLSAVRRGLAHFRKLGAFDLVDAHFIYPDGAAAAYLAARLELPLVITCRGEDILTIPDLPFCRKPVLFALQQATKLVALSTEIRDRMIELGADENKIVLIPNGVDTDKFAPVDQDAARQRCGLPLDRKIITSVGYRLERKGFHILIEAVAALRNEFPDLLVVIVGGPARWGQDYTPQIEETIQRNGMEKHVVLAGPKSQSELSDWYNAGDLFALMTSREGSPNVLMEALATGSPAVATPVGGIPQVLADETLGVVLENRSVPAAIDSLRKSLTTTWDRTEIRRKMELRSWRATAQQVDQVFQAALS